MQNFTVAVTRLRWLTARTFEIGCKRPQGYTYLPGQQISFFDAGVHRDYTPINAPQDSELLFCIRHLPQGRFTSRLAQAKPGDEFQISPPFGYFTFSKSVRPAVFIATGTGIAPFVAFARSGVSAFYLLHGVRTSDDLYYFEELSRTARQITACLSEAQPNQGPAHAFFGRVDRYLSDHFPQGVFDFYLCGRSEMIQDVTQVIDRRFPGSLIFAESFF